MIKLLTIAAVLVPLSASAQFTDHFANWRQATQANQAKYSAIESARAAKREAMYSNRKPSNSKHRAASRRVTGRK
jgi:opacity protein-like surface antigen